MTSLNAAQAVEVIKSKFGHVGQSARVPKLRGGFFSAQLIDSGIEVSNLGNQPFLPWGVFEETANLLLRNGGRAQRGNAVRPKLGERGLPINSIEGHIAHTVYGKKPGDSVFRRITPLACILIWAGVCKAARGELILQEQVGNS
jgi:hypothetical protein